ncbi:MAG: hypothetical protein Q7S92_07160 [Candidatus Diapherotrites archaeon]|nr:hypothetical protein [Candidatus Diapherotrites archaeon]
MNSRGQAGAVFRFLVEVIMGALILAIILGAVNYFSQARIDVSERRLSNAFENAFEKVIGNPDPTTQSVVLEKDLLMQPIIYGTKQFSSGYDIEDVCIDFISSSNKVFQVGQGNKTIEIKQSIQTNVFMQCFAASAVPISSPSVSDPTNCPIYCIISFGKPLPLPA